VIWAKATMEEKHKLLAIMMDAIYIDLLTTQSSGNTAQANVLLFV